MAFYENTFIARQDVTTAQVEAMATTFTQIIQSFRGEVSKTEVCGLRSLAYRINKNQKGHFVHMNISCEPQGIAEMERQMKLNEDVLRYLTVRVETLDSNPSKLMQRTYGNDRYRSPDNDQDEQPSQPKAERSYSDRPSRPVYQASLKEDEGETL